MNDNFSSMYENDSHPPDAKSLRTKMHTKMVATLVALVFLATASIGVLFFAANKSQDQRSKASETSDQMGYCAPTCKSPYVRSDLGTSTCQQTGYVYCVLPNSPKPTGDASLPKVTSAPTTENDYEPNDYSKYGFTKAYGPISESTHTYSIGAGCTTSWDCADGSDAFYFFPKGQLLTIKLAPNTLGKQLEFLLVDESGNISNLVGRAAVGTDGKATLTTMVQPGKKYYLQISIMGNTAVNEKGQEFTYTLAISSMVATPTPASTANCPICTNYNTNTLACATVPNGSMCIDAYSSKGTCLNGKCITSALSPTPPIKVTATPTPSISSICLGRSNGYVCAAGKICYNGQCIYSQQVAVTPTPVTLKEIEPNNSQGQAQSLGWAGNYTFSFTSSDPEDFFFFTPNAVGNEFTITNIPTGHNAHLYIYNSSMVLMGYSGNNYNENEKITVSLEVGKKYYIRVQNRSATNFSYHLGYWATTPQVSTPTPYR